MRQKSLKQILCHILVLVLACSGMVQTEHAYGGEEGTVPAQLAEIQEAKQKALNWLEGQQGEDGRAGTSPLVNDTCMVLEQFREEGMEADSSWLAEQLTRKEHENTDSLSRSYCALRQEELLERLLTMQNPDGGWGLTSDYESEVLDSMLALEALAYTENGPEQPECNRLITYLRSIQQEDGGFAYMEGMESDPVLTLRIGIAAAGFQRRQTGIHLSLGMMLRNMDKWMADRQPSPELAESFEEGACQCLYRLEREQDMEGAEEELL